ncbi:unnamed protein product [Candidula unifasciata]|uniref:NAD(P)-binding domain-containing protein n=1 Tax=Candidula unifasciata TaxID=100452 RepID=A0A8S3ZH59_9EUPU|nr:unnamed protein product [Candidula unifasciata]
MSFIIIIINQDFIYTTPLSTHNVLIHSDFKPEMERFRALGRSAFVLGYTGLAGKALVKELNKAKIFTKVVLIGRREIPLDVGPEFKQKVVDFGKIHEHKDVFQGLDTGFCCLGVSSKGISQEDYIRITRDYCVSAAQVAKEQGCKHFTMLTGNGTKKDSWYLFGRVKAELEEKLEEMNFDRLSIYRPAMILGDSEGMKVSEKLARACFKPITYLSPTRLAISDSLLARGMIVNVVKPHDPSVREIYENKAIHDLAHNWKD